MDGFDVERVPMDEVVSERQGPWEEGDVLVVPVYEEQMVVSRRLVLKEQLRVRRIQTVEHLDVEETLRREHAAVEYPRGHRLLHERRVERDVVSLSEPDAEEPLGDLVRRVFG